MARQHDADLCDRIHALEEEVATLKRELEVHRDLGQHHGWYGWYAYPYPYYPGWWQHPTISGGTGDSMPNGSTVISTGTTYQLTGNELSTLT